MKKYNKNRPRRTDYGPGGGKPAVHNQRKPFNPRKYGRLWGSLDFDLNLDAHPVGEANGPVIGALRVGGKKFDLTWTECNRIIETLSDAKYRFNIGKRLGM